MARSRGLLQNEKGASAVEFVLAFPVLMIFIIGILQLGVLFSANAGLRQAVEEGARYATIFPSPTDTQITTRVSDRQFGLVASRITGPTVAHGTSNGVNFVDVSMSYSVPLDFVLFTTAPVTLSYTRRAYQP
ncbi:TadE family protein [Rhizorhapis sp.]|uniref:TadE/TadG family type IV pilus assembly protein n=1 Tax=Rhizorhapis sp. TaxID=1968842 RepID=UPI002B4A3603|nr:TadE family protein [Rhizorhapis sp.]HKR18462.1 TadE family protein [Rhizorhapis sp.]